jgi:hypothetical protein
MPQRKARRNKEKGEQATAPHLEDAPRGAAVDPQRLIQRTVERSAVAPELSPELLLLLGIGERRRVANSPLHLGGVTGAGGRGLGAVPSTPRHHVALAPPHEGPLLGPCRCFRPATYYGEYPK